MTDPSSPSPSDHETLSYSIMSQIDLICDEFEQGLRLDPKPRLEDFLSRVAPIGRLRLLRDLISLEVESRGHDAKIDFSDYYRRFPDSQAALQQLEMELELWRDNSHQTPRAGHDGEITVVGVPLPQLKNFKLLDIAGSGGFGTVWRALDLRLLRDVAVKIPRADRVDPLDLSGVIREARVAAKLRHPNIVSVHEVGEENGTSFIVTDFIDGVNLKEWRKKRSVNALDSARLVAKLAVAVQHAHNNGVIHRDLKPANVLMDSKGEPHIADFGLAKREARDDSLAVDGQVLGTPAYMAPEQARADHAEIDRRTDVYSLGVILYELLTGKTPFRGDVPQMLIQILEATPVAPRRINPQIPKDLEAICLKCLAKEKSQRYDSAQALADDIYLFLSGETLRGIPAAMPNRVWKWFRRNRRFVVTTSVIALMVAIVSGGFMAWQYRNAKPAVPLSIVEFTTEPPGCEITVAAIDPVSGEPDPTKIQNARGKSPVKMSLAGGDYLIVAVLDSQRFNEVYRRVPEEGESVSYAYTHKKFFRQPSGVVQVPVIPIPRPDVTLGMGFCEGSEHLIEPGRLGKAGKSWRIPAFYVDRSKVTIAALKEWKLPKEMIDAAGPGPIALQRHIDAVRRMEEVGKRLPSAAELYYLLNTVCPALGGNEAQDVPCMLSDKSHIEGLRSGLGEWTSTKPGGPFSGCPELPKTLALGSESRVIGGRAMNQNQPVRTETGFSVEKEQIHAAGVRGVRSAKPRRESSDFASSSTMSVGR